MPGDLPGKIKPLEKNNITYVAFDAEALGIDRECFRMGAQLQADGTVNPVFRRSLEALARKYPPVVEPEDALKLDPLGSPDEQINYVYINLLKRDADELGKGNELDFKAKMERQAEAEKSKKLEALNNEKLGIAVITLPADNQSLFGQLDKHDGKLKPELKTETKFIDLFKEIQSSIKEDRNDFYFSDAIKKRLFGDPFQTGTQDNRQPKELYDAAVQQIVGNGVLPENFTEEQRAAILFQFIKFNLSDYILQKLNPKAYNFTCKDGIDRGGVHTLWYHMNFLYKNSSAPTPPQKPTKPMTLEQFQKHLDAPALLVKDRPLNDHRTILWNTLNERMKGDSDFNIAHPWAIKWLEDNRPSKTRKSNPTAATAVFKTELSLETLQAVGAAKCLNSEFKIKVSVDMQLQTNLKDVLKDIFRISKFTVNQPDNKPKEYLGQSFNTETQMNTLIENICACQPPDKKEQMKLQLQQYCHSGAFLSTAQTAIYNFFFADGLMFTPKLQTTNCVFHLNKNGTIEFTESYEIESIVTPPKELAEQVAGKVSCTSILVLDAQGNLQQTQGVVTLTSSSKELVTLFKSVETAVKLNAEQVSDVVPDDEFEDPELVQPASAVKEKTGVLQWLQKAIASFFGQKPKLEQTPTSPSPKNTSPETQSKLANLMSRLPSPHTFKQDQKLQAKFFTPSADSSRPSPLPPVNPVNPVEPKQPVAPSSPGGRKP